MLRGAELVTATTADHVRLQGSLVTAELERAGNAHADAGRIEAVVLTHAVAGNFYNSRFLSQIAISLVQQGISVVVANNRGHDVINYISAGGMRRSSGAAYEIVADCQWDLHAWVDLLVKRGYRRIGLAGHSLGAIKSLYAQAFRPHPNVAAVGTFSASRLSYEDFIGSDQRETFEKLLTRAQSLCDEGRGRELMDVSFPFPVLISAQTYVDKYGLASRYNWLKFIGKIDVPVWLGFGERELVDNAAFQGVIGQVEQLGLDRRRVVTEVIPGANHYYSGCMVAAAEQLGAWFASLDLQS